MCVCGGYLGYICCFCCFVGCGVRVWLAFAWQVIPFNALGVIVLSCVVVFVSCGVLWVYAVFRFCL